MPLTPGDRLGNYEVEALLGSGGMGEVYRARDLKPANIKVRDDGTVKVLDFGLAKLVESTADAGIHPAASLTNSPTITPPAMVTGVGVLLGTAAYMSPEQAKGRPADKRSDIWSFGCVLYEMVTGRRPFDGDDASDTLAAVLRSDPDWSKLPTTTPPSIRRLLRRCLQKSPRRRLADMSGVRLELEDPDDMTAVPTEASFRRRRSEWIAWSAAALTFIVAVAGWLYKAPADRTTIGAIRVELSTPPTSQPESIAVSHDGRTIAFVAESDGRSQLWIRPLEPGGGHPLAGTEEARDPFWSPDDRSIGFFADSMLKKIDLESGTVTSPAPARRPNGGTWNRSGIILFGADTGPILRVSDKGADLTTAMSVAENAFSGGYRSPQFLPNGRHFIFSASVGTRMGRIR